MHPLWKDKRGLALYLLSWGVLGVLFSAVAAVRGELGWGEAHGAIVLPTILFGFICLSSWYLCQAFPVDRTPVPRILAAFLTASVVTSAIWVLGIMGWAMLLERAGVGDGLPGRVWSGAVQWFATGNVLFLLAVALHYLLIAMQKAGETERRALQLSLLARDAELRALRAQVDPHFLFNSLNSISALTSSDPPVARAMVLRLAGFLRAALKAGRRHQVTLEEELTLVRDYLEIERVRFGDRLTIDLQAAPDAAACAVPPLIIQPLVENAVKHGIAHRLAGGTIALSASRSGDCLHLRVTNPVEKDTPHGEGMGLSSVRQRLELLYGRDATLKAVELEGEFVVELDIPVREARS